MRTTGLCCLLVVGALSSSRALRAGAVGYTFSTLHIPGAVTAIANDINDAGQVVGSFTNGLDNREHGFLLTNGTLTHVDAPGEYGTSPMGINNSGVIVGDVEVTVTGVRSAFVDVNGVITIFHDPYNTPFTIAKGINNKGQIIGEFGGFSNNSLGEQGFLYSNGVMTTINYPGSFNTDLRGINDAGQIVGRYWDNASGREHSFIYFNGVFTTIDFPGAIASNFERINNLGLIVGYHPNEGFLYSNGEFTPIDYPGPQTSFTQVTGINDASQLVGNYTTGTPATTPFLAVPVPEPGPVTLSLVGLSGVVALRRRC